jgi:hypothetical protein
LFMRSNAVAETFATQLQLEHKNVSIDELYRFEPSQKVAPSIMLLPETHKFSDKVAHFTLTTTDNRKTLAFFYTANLNILVPCSVCCFSSPHTLTH